MTPYQHDLPNHTSPVVRAILARQEEMAVQLLMGTAVLDTPLYVRVTKVLDKGSFGPEGHPHIWEGYTLEGYMFRAPQVGEPFRVLRTIRNEVPCLGIFMTSDVVSVVSPGGAAVQEGTAQWQVNTRNSRYEVTLMVGPDTGVPAVEPELLSALSADMRATSKRAT